MTLSTSAGYTDTPISGVTSLTFPRGLVNFGANFRVKSEIATEAVATNLTTPIDRPERFRWSISDIANVYSKTDIDPSVYSPSRKGVSVLCQLTEVFSTTDSTDSTFRVDSPLSMHLVLTLPATEFLTADMVQTALGRLISGLYETGALSTERLQALVRGSLLPKDI